MRICLIICVISTILMVGGCDCDKSTPPPPVDETFYMDLTPASNVIAPDDTVTLTGSINSVENLFAVAFDLAFDSTRLNYESVSIPAGGLLGNGAMSFSSIIDGGVSISLGKTQTTANDNISGNGVLFEVAFTGAAVGSTSVQIQNVFIIDESGAENPDMGNLILNSADIIIQ